MKRNDFVNRIFGLILGIGILISGCGGGGGGSNLLAEVSGVVYDESGNAVRNAQVDINSNGKTSFSNSAGNYVITGAPTGTQLVQANITVNSVAYYAENYAILTEGERAKNINLVIVKVSELASIHGSLRDRNGNLVSGGKVFVRDAATNTTLTSHYGISDANGNYVIAGLHSGITYDIFANALTFNADSDVFTLNSREDRRLDFTLPDATNTILGPPNGLSAVAWTSPPEVTRSENLRSAILGLKHHLDPRVAKKAVTRNTLAGYPIEVDLFWNPISSSSLLGYGVYRGVGGGARVNTDFIRDPLAESFADQDSNMIEGKTYSYQLTTLNTSFDGLGNGESAKSSAVEATTIGDVQLQSVQGPLSTPTFNWIETYTSAAPSDVFYAVFLYDNYPNFSSSPRWDSYGTPTQNLFVTYNGPSLSAGHTYYYMVLAFTGTTAKSISQVGSFTAN